MTEAATGSISNPPPGKTRLITRSDDVATFTANRETDVRTALTRGIAEYLEQLEAQALGGRKLTFKKVLDTWAEPERQAQYPSLSILTPSPGSYDASGFTPSVDPKERLPAPDGRYVVKLAEFSVDMTLEVWANDPKERAELTAALEEMLNPVVYMYGFHLELPHYYNLRATYEMTSLQYPDAEEDAMRRYRRSLFVVHGNVPLVKLAAFPDARPLFNLQAVGPEVDVVVNLTVS